MSDRIHFNNGGDVGIGGPRRTLLHVTDEHINTSSGASLGSGQCFDFADGFVPGNPLVLVPEGGICRVEPTRKKQRCVYCGQMSWVDETISCPNCQAQVFEDVL